jgi:CO/xanthine dehydrogenase FAD-binding subunit
MKPAPLEYCRPADVDEACAVLAADDGARVIAGGQTLVPLMAMRLARPTLLIDIGRLADRPTRIAPEMRRNADDEQRARARYYATIGIR